MKAIGIILAGGNNNRMKELTAKRAVPALPVAGSFRAIDFSLSSMSNSHIQTVAILTQYNARSLNEHLSSSKWWNFGRKQGGLFLFTPTVTADNSDWYRGTADAMYQNIDFLKRRHEPYVIISSGDCVYKLDFNRVLDFHIEKKSDITVVCKDSYPLLLGTESQSRRRLGLGIYISVTMEYTCQHSCFSLSTGESRMIRMANKSYTPSKGHFCFFIF